VLKANTNIIHQFTRTPTPTIKGEAKIGAALSADKGDWSHTPDFTYRWYADGKVIASATKDTYVTTAADAGKKISVSLTGSRVGYAAATRTSGKTAQIGVFTNAPIPTIKGKAKVGTTLGIDAGSLSALPKDSKFAYQWYASGKAISKATTDRLKLTKSQIGKKITVSLTVTAPGYVKTTKGSKQTSAVTDIFKKTPTP
jgi:activator of 2-hydroxyglutaryl-CoA dehydratase